MALLLDSRKPRLHQRPELRPFRRLLCWWFDRRL